MKTASLVSVPLLLLLLVVPSSLDAQFAQQERRTAHNSVYGEILGKGVLYGLFYERLLTDRLGAGIGFSTWGLDFGFVDMESVTLVPVYLSWYPLGDQDRLYLDGGVDFASANVSVRIFGGASAEGTGTIGFAGLGYCHNSRDGGIILKLGPMLFFGNGEVRVWGNLSVGVSF
jgi:hypothetical protein